MNNLMFNVVKAIVTYISFTILFMLMMESCSRYPEGVEQALKLAGDNRIELERVLNITIKIRMIV